MSLPMSFYFGLCTPPPWWNNLRFDLLCTKYNDLTYISSRLFSYLSSHLLTNASISGLHLYPYLSSHLVMLLVFPPVRPSLPPSLLTFSDLLFRLSNYIVEVTAHEDEILGARTTTCNTKETRLHETSAFVVAPL